MSLASRPRLAVLSGAVALCAVAGAPGATASTDVAPGAQAAASSRADKERAIRTCVNRERRKRGIAPLSFDRDLGRAARLHAGNMGRHDFFDHEDHLGRSPSERVALYTDRFTGAGENISGGHRTASATCASWMRSSGHRANFLNRSYRFIGTGYATGGRYGHLWVQVFAGAPRGG